MRDFRGSSLNRLRVVKIFPLGEGQGFGRHRDGSSKEEGQRLGLTLFPPLSFLVMVISGVLLTLDEGQHCPPRIT